MRSVFVFLCVAVGACAQIGAPVPVFKPLPLLAEYLSLTDAQTTSILQNNAEFNTFSASKQARIIQVQQEIYENTQADPLDPTALGVRYAEVEGICRQLRDKANEIYRRNVTLLTSAQKDKLKTLEDAFKLMATFYEAQSSALIGPYPMSPIALSATNANLGSMPVPTSVVGSLGTASGCQTQFVNGIPARVIRVQDSPSTPATRNP